VEVYSHIIDLIALPRADVVMNCILFVCIMLNSSVNHIISLLEPVCYLNYNIGLDSRGIKEVLHMDGEYCPGCVYMVWFAIIATTSDIPWR